MNKRYWLRGGLLGLLILVLSVIFHRILWSLNISIEITEILIIAKPFLLLTGIIMGLIAKFFQISREASYIFLENNIATIMITVNIMVYFFAGVIIGGIYGKIKNSKNKVI